MNTVKSLAWPVGLGLLGLVGLFYVIQKTRTPTGTGD